MGLGQNHPDHIHSVALATTVAERFSVLLSLEEAVNFLSDERVDDEINRFVFDFEADVLVGRCCFSVRFFLLLFSSFFSPVCF